jgi:peroxiredoxin
MTTKSLTETLADWRDKVGEPFRAPNDAVVRRLIDVGAAALALKAGDPFPEFALPNAEGEIVRSADLLTDGPVVLSFYRGVWCPFCSAELEALHDSEPAIRGAGGKLVTISPEVGGLPLRVKQERGFKFDVLVDVDNGLALRCGLVFRISEDLIRVFMANGIDFPLFYGNNSWFLPMPATYIVGRDGLIAHAYVNPEFRERLDPRDIVTYLRKMNGKV